MFVGREVEIVEFNDILPIKNDGKDPNPTIAVIDYQMTNNSTNTKTRDEIGWFGKSIC